MTDTLDMKNGLRFEAETEYLYQKKIDELKTSSYELEVRCERYKRAYELALYYVEGDATWEGLKARCEAIICGEAAFPDASDRSEG